MSATTGVDTLSPDRQKIVEECKLCCQFNQGQPYENWVKVMQQATVNELDREHILAFSLHHFGLSNSCEILKKIEFLLDLGVRINVADGLRLPPLHLAVEYGFESVVELLLARGANPNYNGHAALISNMYLRSITPTYPLDCVKDEKVAKLLVDKGAYKYTRYVAPTEFIKWGILRNIRQNRLNAEPAEEIIQETAAILKKHGVTRL